MSICISSHPFGNHTSCYLRLTLHQHLSLRLANGVVGGRNSDNRYCPVLQDPYSSVALPADIFVQHHSQVLEHEMSTPSYDGQALSSLYWTAVSFTPNERAQKAGMFIDGPRLLVELLPNSTISTSSLRSLLDTERETPTTGSHDIYICI